MKQEFISEERVLQAVKEAIAETLSIEPGEMKPRDSLIKDLDAESLDFLDINYRIEQAFGIKMARHFILEHIEDLFGEGSAIDAEGKLTEKAVGLLKIRLKDDLTGITAGTDMDDIPAHVTVQSMVNGVMDVLDTLPETCACGATAWAAQDGSHIKCSSCSEPAGFTNGDDLSVQWLKQVQEEKNVF